MIQRGRKSKAALAIVAALPASHVTRPPPPDYLTDEQADEWKAIVNNQPPDFFPRDTHAVLAQYCRHQSAVKRIAKLVNVAERKVMRSASIQNLDAYDRLLRMQEREGKALAALATRMRLTQQSRYDKKISRPGKDASECPPWAED